MNESRFRLTVTSSRGSQRVDVRMELRDDSPSRKVVYLVVPVGASLAAGFFEARLVEVGANVWQVDVIDAHIATLRGRGVGPAVLVVPTFMKIAEAKNKPSEVASRLPAFGHRRLDEIGYAQIQDYAAALAERRSKKTVNNTLAVLRRLLVVAKKRELIAVLPEIGWLRAPMPEFDFLSFEEAERLLEAAQPEAESGARAVVPGYGASGGMPSGIPSPATSSCGASP